MSIEAPGSISSANKHYQCYTEGLNAVLVWRRASEWMAEVLVGTGAGAGTCSTYLIGRGVGVTVDMPPDQ
jgi:hypothetical protein